MPDAQQRDVGPGAAAATPEAAALAYAPRRKTKGNMQRVHTLAAFEIGGFVGTLAGCVGRCLELRGRLRSCCIPFAHRFALPPLPGCT